MSGGFLPPVVATLRADISDYQAKMGVARGEASTLASQGGGNFEKFAAVGKTALIGLGAVAVATAVIGVKAAMDQEAAHARLDTAITNSHQSVSRWGDAVEQASNHAINMGFSDVALESSLAKLVPVTSNVGQATHEMSLAEDIARGRHIDLESATQLLVKVQTGHVGLLGRLGIATKDATGATISQDEAIRRLAGTYGGDASNYAHTFSGELDVLQSKGEHLAEQFGQVLIPVIVGVGGALADGVSWTLQSKDALIGLAIVVGGPLVFAMGAYIVETTIAATETGYLLALMAADKVVAFAGAIMEGVSSLLAMGPVLLGVTGGLVAAGAAIFYFETTDSVFERNQAAAKSWGDTLISAAKGTGNELKVLEGTHRSLTQEIATNKAGVQDLEQNYAKYGITIDQANDRALRLGFSTDLLQQKDKLVTDAIKSLNAEHQKNLIVAEAVAKSMGITIPNAAQMSSTQLKAMQSAVKASGDEFGTWATQAMLNAGLTSSAISAAAKSAVQFGTDVGKSWDSFVNQIATHDFSQPVKQQVAVSEQSFEQFFVGNIITANAWMGHLQGLIDAGVSPSIVSAFAKAGPGMDAQLQAMDAMVFIHGATWVNQMYASGDAQRVALQQSYAAQTVDLAIAQAERVAIYKAATDLVVNGNEQGLQNLTGSTDKNLAQMAQTIWDKYHQGAVNAQGELNTIPTDHTTDVNVNDYASMKAAAIQYAIDNLHGKNIDITLTLMSNVGDQGALLQALGASGQGFAPGNYGAHGLVGLARGGSAGMIVGPHQPVVIGEGLSREAVVPFDDFGDMVATIRNTGRAKDFMRASMAAGAVPKMFEQQSSKAGGSAPGSLHQQATVVIVRSEEEALKHVPEFAHGKARAAFRSGRRS